MKKIYWAPFNPTEKLQGRYYHSTGFHINGQDIPGGKDAGEYIDGSDIRTFQTYIDSIPTTPFYLDFAKNQPYLFSRERLRGSCITTSNEYNHNFTWVEDFTHNYSVGDKPLNAFDKNVYVDGFPITKQHVYQINVTAGSACQRNHYFWVITLLTLNISSQGIMLEKGI